MPNAPLCILDDVLDAAACAALMQRIEQLGPTSTRVRTPWGARVDPTLRNNARVWFDDDPLAAAIFEAILPGVQALKTRWPSLLTGIPRRCEATFRGYRYRAGERFALHQDSSFVDDDGARTLVTVLVYLNGGEAGKELVGGQTRFSDLGIEVTPARGRACLFPHVLPHEGVVVEAGTKYLLRTNVLFAHDLSYDRGPTEPELR